MLYTPLPVAIAVAFVHSFLNVVVGSIISNETFDAQNRSTIPPFQCDNDTISNTFIGPHFRGIPPSRTILESVESMRQRENSILEYYARLPLPLNNSLDEYLNPFFTAEPPTNPMLNSRDDIRAIVNRYVSRILLGCYHNSDMDQIFLDASTRPFAEVGSSSYRKSCFRDGDYDFSTIDLLQLLLVSQQHPGSIPETVFGAIRDRLLPINGTISGDSAYTVQCKFELGSIIRLSSAVQVGFDTENHILQIEISRYLTNQLLLEVYPETQEYNNTVNGNTHWLLEHLSTFLHKYFYEYNSRPYQAFTINAISLLHSFAVDPDLVLVADMLLDVVTSLSGIQMNLLRRFAPFRRQPEYVQKTQSWAGDSEFLRLAMLVGNYGTLEGPYYILPKSPEVNSSLGDNNLVPTITGKYRVKDFVWNMMFRGNDESPSSGSAEYFVMNHNAVEMYYTTPKVLISAGGNHVKSLIPPLTFPKRFCLFRTCLFKGFIINRIIGEILPQFDKGEWGWSRPTTIVPSNESSTDILDMIRFVGHRDPEVAPLSRNLCVAPNFACGLQLEYGNKIDPILDQCSIAVGDWRFLDLTENNGDPSCPTYGYYMAVYRRSCMDASCSNKADNYGIIELSDNNTILSFTTFQEMVLSNNPFLFLSNGTHTYTQISGATIQFEIDPMTEEESQIIQVTLNDGANEYDRKMTFDRNYRNWPLAWSAYGSMQSTSALGRWTFDTGTQRYIYDVTNPLSPKRILSNLPHLVQYNIVSSENTPPSSSPLPPTIRGRYFDDSTSVIENDTIQRIAFTYNFFSVSGFRIQWRKSGLQSTHGSMKESSSWWHHRVVEYELEEQESIVTVGIGSAEYFGIPRVNRIRLLITNVSENKSRTIVVGFGKREEAVYETTTSSDHIIAFYGRASEDMIHTLGVVVVGST